MAKSKNTGFTYRSSATGRFVTEKHTKAHPSTSHKETGSFVRVRDSSSGGTVVGRNAVTGRFVIAPAVKAGRSFVKNKTNVVREVIKDKREK